jgi:hypothetical protein
MDGLGMFRKGIDETDNSMIMSVWLYVTGIESPN